MSDKYKSAEKALATLQSILTETYSSIVQDAAIQRFEYTFEICWKTLQAYLKEQEGIVANSPKSAYREALLVGILAVDEVERALEMTDDRNLTTHTYHEEVAQHIFNKLPEYAKLLEKLLRGIKNKK